MIDLSTVYAFLERIPLHILCQCVYFAFLFFFGQSFIQCLSLLEMKWFLLESCFFFFLGQSSETGPMSM